MAPTPLIKINDFYLKREDQNPTGSAKDRALSVQIAALVDKKIKNAVISSTGNAAISALYYCQIHQIKLTIFVSPKINPAKLKLLSSANVISTQNPIKAAFNYARLNNASFLRLSTDPNALLGYQNITKDLTLQLPQISSLFITVGSGATLIGMSHLLSNTTKIYAVQPAVYCPIASHYDTDFQKETLSITDALGVKFLPLKKKLLSTINSGLVIQNQQIKEASNFLKSKNIITSNESSLALAGYFKAKIKKLDIGDYPVIILSGAKR